MDSLPDTATLQEIQYYINVQGKIQEGIMDKNIENKIKPVLTNNSKHNNHDFFKSAGLWKDRDIDANDLRKKAWNIA